MPGLMVAPNGARRGKSAHPALPLTDDELVNTAIRCRQEGADGIHIHLRDDDAQHLLDATRYASVLAKLSEAVPDLYLQVTSESANRYGAAAQQKMVRALKPRHVSIALREMVQTEDDWPAATEFYAWTEEAGVEVQHIVYSTDELSLFLKSCASGRIPGDHHMLQLVLGTYDGSERSKPDKIGEFADMMSASGLSLDWGLCAFGPEETECLVEAVRHGGKARVGFENSLWNADGTVANDNAERVREVRAGIAKLAG